MVTGFGLRGTLGTISIVMSVTDRATKKLQRIGKSVTGLNERVMATAGTLRTAGVAITAFTAMFMAGAMEIVKGWAPVEKTLAEVSALAVESGKTWKEWGLIAFEVAENLRLPMRDVTAAMYEVVSAGIDQEEQVRAVATEAGKLAMIHGVDMPSATRLALTTAKAFGVELTKVESITRVMNATIGGALLRLDDLAHTLKYAAPVAASVKWEFEGLAAGIMAMADMGIRGSKAGTALRAVVTRLAKPTAEARDWMRRLGLEFFELDPAATAVRDAMRRAGAEFQRLQDEIRATEDRIEDLSMRMEGLSVAERRIRLQIRKIRHEAAMEDRELTFEELERIEELERQAESLSFRREQLALQEAEARLEKRKLTKQSEEQRETEERLAAELETLRGEMLELPEIAAELARAFAGLTDQQKLQAVTSIFGRRALSGVLAMIADVNPEVAVSESVWAGLAAAEGIAIEQTETLNIGIQEMRDLLKAEAAAGILSNAMLEEAISAKGVNIALTEQMNALLRVSYDEMMRGGEAMLYTVEASRAMQEAMFRGFIEISRLMGGFFGLFGISGETATVMMMLLGPSLLFISSLIYTLVPAVTLLNSKFVALKLSTSAAWGAIGLLITSFFLLTKASKEVKIIVGAVGLTIGTLILVLKSLKLSVISAKIAWAGLYGAIFGVVGIFTWFNEVVPAAERGLWLLVAALMVLASWLITAAIAKLTLVAAMTLGIAIPGIILAIAAATHEMNRAMSEATKTAEGLSEQVAVRSLSDSLEVAADASTGFKRALDTADESMLKLIRDTETLEMGLRAMPAVGIGIGAPEAMAPAAAEGITIGSVNISVTTGPVTGIEDIDEIATRISDVFVDRVRRARGV